MKIQPIGFFIATVLSGASCFAMAWTEHGAGGTVELSGTLQPVKMVTPWEIKVGNISDVDVKITKGRKVFVFKPIKGTSATSQGALLLGIRTKSTLFNGGPGISPQIDFGGRVQYDKGRGNGAMPMLIDVMSETGGGKIGTLSADVLGLAAHYYMHKEEPDNRGYRKSLAAEPGTAFFGGLPKFGTELSHNSPRARAEKMDPEVVANFSVPSDVPLFSSSSENFQGTEYLYSAFYAAGFEPESLLTITLNEPVTDDTPIKWRASLPVTVSYI